MGLHLAVYCHVQFLLILPGSFEREGLVLLVAFFFLGDFLGDGDLRLCFWGVGGGGGGDRHDDRGDGDGDVAVPCNASPGALMIWRLNWI
jgi:hypothetical protein